MDKLSLADRLRDYLTTTFPLGPSDAAEIKDIEVAARLFDPHNESFNTLLRKDLSVLIGRRGSGKTALLNKLQISGIPRQILQAEPEECCLRLSSL